MSNPHPLSDSTTPLDELCALLNEELWRQQDVYDACLAQRAAANRCDAAALEAKTNEIVVLVQAAAESEKHRRNAMREIFGRNAVPVERQTLTELLAHVPEPWRSNLRDLQTKLRAVLEAIQQQTRANASVFRGSLRSIRNAESMLTGRRHEEPSAYTQTGGESHSRGRAPRLVDARG